MNELKAPLAWKEGQDQEEVGIEVTQVGISI